MRRTAVLAVLLCAALPASGAHAAQRVSVADPAGGARWTAAQSTRPGGWICTTLRHGTLAKGRNCSRLSGRLAFSYRVQTERARDPHAVRTILVVALDPDVVRASLRTPDGTRTYRRRAGHPRILLAVLAGRVERPDLRVVVRRGGRTTTLVQGSPPSVRVADPQRGPAWRSVGRAAPDGGVCVAWERVPPRFAPLPEPVRGAPRCGRAGADLPVAVAQRVQGRLVIVGAAGEAVRGVVLRGPSGDRPVQLEPRTRALLAVLDGATDPAALRLVATRFDGQQIVQPLRVVA